MLRAITFNRSVVTPDHINYLLVFIMLSNVSMFLGLNAAKRKIVYDENIPEDQSPAKALNVIIILFVAIIILYVGLIYRDCLFVLRKSSYQEARTADECFN